MLRKASALLCLSVVLAACGGGADTTNDHSPRSAAVAHSEPSGEPTPTTVSEDIHRSWASSAALNRAEVQQTTVEAPPNVAEGPTTKAFAAPSAPLYRFYNIQTGAHLLTRDVNERDRTLNTLPQYRYEGAVFAAWSASAAGLSPVYRFYNTTTGTHFFTISETERATLQATRPDLRLEGAAYYASKTAASGTTALFRFYHRQRGFHFYTTSVAERDSIIANLAATYQYEGVGYYVNASIGTYGRALASLAGKANSKGYVNSLGENARFETLWGMALSPDGNLYAIDSAGYYGDALTEIRRVTPSGLVTSFVGSRSISGYTDGIGSGVAFRGLYSITFDAAGTGYVGDYRTIRTISPSGVVTTIAGSRTESTAYVNGQAQSARFSNIKGIARDSVGNIFVVDGHAIRKLSPSGVVSTFAGAAPTETYKSGFADGMGTAARFNDPGQMAIDANDNLYVADESNHRIRRITPSGMVTTLAGQSSSGVEDGNGTAARFDNPFAIAVDRATGNIYTADWDGYTVRRITPSGDVTTVVGIAYTPGVFFGALPAGLNRVAGLAVQGNRLYIASLNGIYWTNLP